MAFDSAPKPTADDIYPLSGFSTVEEMRRIGVVVDVQRACLKIRDWGAGNTISKTVRSALPYYLGNFRGMTEERILTVHDFISQYVDLDTFIPGLSNEARTEMFWAIAKNAQDIEAAIRARMKRRSAI